MSDQTKQKPIIGWIDDGGRACLAVAEQPGVVVLQDGDGGCGDCHAHFIALERMGGNLWLCDRLTP